MILKRMISGLALGELNRYVDDNVKQFCESFFSDNIDTEPEDILRDLAFNSIRRAFFNEESLRKRLIDVATYDDLLEILDRAKRHADFASLEASKLSLIEASQLVKAFIERCVDLPELIEFCLQITSTFDPQSKPDSPYLSRIEPSYALYPYQHKVNKRVEFVFNADNRCLVHLPTGAGKTRTAISYVCDTLRKSEEALVLWLADRNELCSQALEEFNLAWESLGNRPTTSYGYFGESKISLGGVDSGFLVCSVQSLWALRNSERSILYRLLADSTDLIIFDEAHKALASTYSEIIQYVLDKNKNSKLLGLTATPGRKIADFDVEDDENQGLAALFGHNKVAMHTPGYLSPIQYLFEKNYLATPKFTDLEYSQSPIIKSDSGKVLVADAIDELSESEIRNRAILECALKEIELGSYIIIFANSVPHAKNLEGIFLLSGVPVAAIDANTPNRSSIVKAYKKKELRVLINYDVLTAGFDAPHTNVAIISRPTRSLVAYSQMAGRAMRGGEKGNQNCVIYTVNDDLPEFTSVARAFAHWDRYWG